MLEKMWNRVTDHRKVYVMDMMPSLIEMPNPTWLGSFSWTTPKERYILRNGAVFHHDNRVSTASALARAYLNEKFEGQRRRCTTAQYQLLLADFRTSPLYASPQSGGEWVAIDLTGAYWQILSRGGWDVDYFPRKFIGVKSDVLDFPYAHHKLMRNILVSTGLRSRMQWWNGKKIQSKLGRNPLYNGILWAFVQDVLNAVAEDMLALGAVHIHTDGYILPAKNEGIAMSLLDGWNLRGEVRARGEGWIKHIGRWRVGSKEVGNRENNRTIELDKVRRLPYQSWLRDKFPKLKLRRLHSSDN